MRIIVDTNKCSGHARCIAVAPKAYELNSDGYNVTPEMEVPKDLEEEARRGARSCPERAITIVEDE